MDDELVIIKLGYKSDELAQGMRQAGEHAKKAGEEGALGFVHAEKEGRAFKKVLHEITDASPALGVALRAFMSPITALLVGGALVFKFFEKGFEESAKLIEQYAERVAKRQREFNESNARAAETVAKRTEAEHEFSEKLEKTRAIEQAKADLQRRYAEARQSSGGDEGEFLQKKKVIDLEEKARIEREIEDARRKRLSLELDAPDQGRLRTLDLMKNRVKELAAEEEKANKEAVAKQEAEVGFGEFIKSGFRGGAVKRRHADEAAAAMREAERLKREREGLEADIRDAETREKRRKKDEDEATSDLLKGPAELARINKELADNESKIIEEQRKKRHEAVEESIKEAKAKHAANEVAFLKEKIQIEELAAKEAEAHDDKVEQVRLKNQLTVDRISLLKAQEEQARNQARLDRELGMARRERGEKERQPYIPTLEALANSVAWRRDFSDETQRRLDATTIGMGMAYAQRFAPKAQELERLEQDARRALFVEGPESRRFKEDVQRIDSLKKGLAAAGLQTSENKLESIDNHIANLVDKASKEGLVVQPVNGP